MAALTVDEALASDSPRLGVFLRLGITPPARMWLGVGKIRTAIDTADTTPIPQVPLADLNVDGAIYHGRGQIMSVPAFQQLINGTAERLTISLSGVDAETRAMAESESASVKGVALLVGLGVFDADWQLIEAPTWLKRLTVDFLSTKRDSSGSATVRTISLSVRSAFTGRRRPGLSYFTNAEQQARAPGDRFCERSGLYSAEVVKTWPRF